MRSRRVLTTFWLVLTMVLWAAGPGVVGALAQDDDISCDDFATQEGAQAALDAEAEYEDALDPDGDGEACDELPAREGDEPTEEATEEATEESNGDPLDGRFGGSRDSFEAEYGDAANDEAGDYPDGFVYETDDAEINVFYHRDVVNFVTVTPAEALAEDDAIDAIASFLPDDFEAEDEAIETDDGDLLTVGHSVALEDAFSAETYERYGASGDQGDLFYLLLLDRGGDVAEVQIGLGDDLQEPVEEETEEPTEEATEEATEEPTEESGNDAEAEAYLADVSEIYGTLTVSVVTFVSTYNDGPASEAEADVATWVETLLGQTEVWTDANATAQGLTPPDGLEGLHADLLEITELLESAATDFVAATQGDETALETATESINSALDLLRAFGDTLTDAGA